MNGGGKAKKKNQRGKANFVVKSRISKRTWSHIRTSVLEKKQERRCGVSRGERSGRERKEVVNLEKNGGKNSEKKAEETEHKQYLDSGGGSTKKG